MAMRLIRSFTHSCDGLATAWCEDHSFRVSAIQAVAGVALASILFAMHHFDLIHWLVLCGASLFILIIETVNTAIEAVTDKASPERSKLAKKAKDIGSAAVLLTRIYALLCWGILLVV